MTRIWLQLLAAIFAAVCLGASCDEGESESDTEKSDCEKADDIIAAAGEEYCGPKDDECCYCRCFNQSKVIDTTQAEECACKLLGGDGANKPMVPPDAGAGDPCEGFSLNEAETCLEDRPACEEDYVSKMEIGCLMSMLD